jgi:hypothetical protein
MDHEHNNSEDSRLPFNDQRLSANTHSASELSSSNDHESGSAYQSSIPSVESTENSGLEIRISKPSYTPSPLHQQQSQSHNETRSSTMEMTQLEKPTILIATVISAADNDDQTSPSQSPDNPFSTPTSATQPLLNPFSPTTPESPETPVSQLQPSSSLTVQQQPQKRRVSISFESPMIMNEQNSNHSHTPRKNSEGARSILSSGRDHHTAIPTISETSPSDSNLQINNVILKTAVESPTAPSLPNGTFQSKSLTRQGTDTHLSPLSPPMASKTDLQRSNTTATAGMKTRERTVSAQSLGGAGKVPSVASVNPLFAGTNKSHRRAKKAQATGASGQRRMSLGAALCIPPPPRIDNNMNLMKFLKLSLGAIGTKSLNSFFRCFTSRDININF